MIDVEFDAEALQDALLDQANILRSALAERVQQKLSDEVLHVRSGALADLSCPPSRTINQIYQSRLVALACHMRQSRSSAERRPPTISLQ